ncbi:uncharacterized protein LOC110830134 [Zootermopsis nevadensis]|uniref:uncharacterized protein LOC110830134 n=1 Tax=Zootermopsis nevadensis TaxID=136037 RepID=UPI000B8EBE59|nr:uncharacterized protein LOC110830134 [Zootermopsis nevadensis]
MAMGTAVILSVTLLLVATDLCLSAPKKYEATEGFLPSPSSYFLQSGDQIAMESTPDNRTAIQERSHVTAESSNAIDERQQEPRFGFLTYGATAVQQNPGTTGLSSLNGQLKLDLGGVVLGAIIGFGAIFILPKILHVFNTGHDGTTGFGSGGGGVGGGFGYRSEDEKNTGIMDVLSRIDETLAHYNIDSSLCMQRAVCTYVKLASEKVTDGSGNNLDALVDSVAG